MTTQLVPFQRELETIREQFDRMMNDLSFPEFGSERFGIPVDLKEKADAFVVTASFPGAKPEDIAVDIRDDRLTLAVTSESEKEEKTETCLLKERRTGSSRRILILPGPVRETEAYAVLEDGVLTLTLPKALEETKQITVHAA